jgi:bifunctional non-homologous end joining protein LigD
VSLSTYKKIRDFKGLRGGPIPSKKPFGSKGNPIFCVQKHAASRLHYDFRLEIDGSLKSWTVPRAPSMDPTIRRLAMKVEDRPLEYAALEGGIPQGTYGAETVEIWDKGEFTIVGDQPADKQFESGKLVFTLRGNKLRGQFTLTRMKAGKRSEPWLLLKHGDEYATSGGEEVEPGKEQGSESIPPEGSHVTSSSFASPVSISIGRLNRLRGAQKAPMPAHIAPQLAMVTEEVPVGNNWLFEIKWDGIRCLCFLRKGKLTLMSRSGTPLTNQFPELEQTIQNLHAEEAILDGEIVVFDEHGRSNFQALQPRIMLTKQKQTRSDGVLILFDLLYFDGYDLRGVSLEERVKLLNTVVEESSVVRLSTHKRGNGEILLDFAKQHGLEGIMAKDARSLYETRRTSSWRKIKLVREQDCVICGFTVGKREAFGSLILGIYRNGDLVFVGNVGTGFDTAQQKRLRTLMDQRTAAKPPFATNPRLPGRVIWVRPELVARIKYTHWTKEDKLRAPVFLGLRTDTTPEQCVREESVLDAQANVPSAPPENHREETPVPTEGATVATVSEIPRQRDSAELRIGERSVKLTNLNKIYFPNDKYTKADLIAYYTEIAEILLPHLAERPLSLRRYPDGIHQKAFFQKDAERGIPEWLRETGSDGTKYIVCKDTAGLYFLVNLGCIDHNPWMSRLASLESPDYLLIDLDPYQCSYEKVMEAALLTRGILDRCELASYPKTSGGDGFHICIPLHHGYTYAQVRRFAELLSLAVQDQQPDLFTTPRSVQKRQAGKVYFDYLQIVKGKTLASVYSVRAHDGAPVSTPLQWSEVHRRRTPYNFTIRTLGKRLDKYGDLFLPTLSCEQTLTGPLTRLEKILQKGI